MDQTTREQSPQDKNNQNYENIQNFIKTETSTNKCTCPIFANNTGYFKKHFCNEGKRNKRT